MSKEIYISSTPHETRLAIVENDALTEIYYERENEYTLAGSIYNGKVTRVLPGMQSSFVDIGLERDAFLYITDFMEEAGDSADFDTNGNGDSGARDRGDRNGSSPTIEHRSGSQLPIKRRPRSPQRPEIAAVGRPWPDVRVATGGDRQPLPAAIAPTDSPDAPDFNRDDFMCPAEFTAESTPAKPPDEANSVKEHRSR
jgi:ribonuclease G